MDGGRKGRREEASRAEASRKGRKEETRQKRRRRRGRREEAGQGGGQQRGSAPRTKLKSSGCNSSELKTVPYS